MQVGFSIFGLLLLATAAAAQTGVRLSPRDPAALIEPKTLVRRYCEMDAQGFRLASDTAKRLESVTTFESLPEWHGFDVIARYEIAGAKSNARGVLVTVNYVVLGRFEIGVGYTPEPRLVTLEIQAVADNDDWKVLGTDNLNRPRISRARTLKWLQDQLATEQDAEWKQTLQRAIQQLQP
ncbi:MAG: hypothetical protein ACE14L_14125 [Terriglobales bacterium]